MGCLLQNKKVLGGGKNCYIKKEGPLNKKESFVNVLLIFC
ncbi:hypothetical protein QN326_03370 [Candidatus Phytoplasma asteris]|uniref:Uncharacterized protein n=1 Tax=Candidatus Phytoplasma asteris TaxID=85620 RepID=A0ABZ3CEZ3_9MOLU